MNKRIASIFLLALSMIIISTCILQAKSAPIGPDAPTKIVYLAVTAGGSVTYSPAGTGSGTLSGTATSGASEQFTEAGGNTLVTFTATPLPGFTFAGWTGVGQFDGQTTIQLNTQAGIGTSSVPLTANFAPQLVVPEYAFGGLAAIVACFIALLSFTAIKRHTKPKVSAIRN